MTGEQAESGGIGGGVVAALAVAVAVILVVAVVQIASTPAAEERETIDGLAVRTVAEALAARDAGELEGRAVAIRGYYSTTPGHSCPAPRDSPSPLELYCTEGDWALAQLDEAVAEITRTVTATSVGMSVQLSVQGRQMAGPWLQPAWLGPAGGDRIGRHFPRPTDMNRAVPVVLIGHFGDPRATRCAPEKLRTCTQRFVLDRAAWVAGESFGAEVWPGDPSVGNVPVMTPAAVQRLAERTLGPDGLVLSLAAVRGKDLAYWDPTTPIDPAGTDVIWYVWAVDGVGAGEAATADRIGRLVFLDATGDLLWNGF